MPLLSPDSAYGVRLWLQRHAKFSSDAWNVAFGKLQVKPLEQRCEKKEHLHSGQLLTKTLAPT